MYLNFQKNARLAVITGRLLGAKDRPENAEEAHALGRTMLCALHDEDALEAQCLAAELRELSDEARDGFGATWLRLRMNTITRHVRDEVACVAALLAGFFIVNLHDTMRPDDWRDHSDLSVGDADVAVLSVPKEYSWTGRQFVTADD